MSPSERKHRLNVIVAFAMVYVFWGSTFLAIRVVVSNVPPTMMGTVRFLVAGPIMLAICAALKKKIAITGRDFLMLGTIGVLLLSGGNVVVGWAEVSVPSGLAALILAVTPIWVAIIEAWILKSDRLSRRGIVGLFFGSAGLMILLWPKLHATDALGRQQLIGTIMLILASLSWTIGSIISRRTKVSIGPFAATGWQMTIAGSFNFLLAFALGDLHRGTWNSSALWAVGYLITGGSLLGFTAYIWLLEHVPTAKVATYAYVNPIVAVILGMIVLHEKVDGYILAGSAVIIAGVILVTTSKVKAGTADLAAMKKQELAACEVGAD
jgi:drug/metabolite transporter (DMT)-like permease